MDLVASTGLLDWICMLSFGAVAGKTGRNIQLVNVSVLLWLKILFRLGGGSGGSLRRGLLVLPSFARDFGVRGREHIQICCNWPFKANQLVCLLHERAADKSQAGGRRCRREEKNHCLRKGAHGLVREMKQRVEPERLWHRQTLRPSALPSSQGRGFRSVPRRTGDKKKAWLSMFPLALLPERGYQDRNELVAKAHYRLSPPPGTRTGGWFRCRSTWKQAPPSAISSLPALLFHHYLRRWDAAFGEPCLVFQDWRAECCPGFSRRRNRRPSDLTPFPFLKMKEKSALVCSQTGFDRIFKIKICEMREIWICEEVLCERTSWIPC